MVSRLVILSIVLIATGLVLVSIGDPALRSVGSSSTGTVTNFTFSRTFTGPFTRTFTSGTFSFPGTLTGFPRNFTIGIPTSSGSSGLTTSELESLVGVALVGAGLLLEVFSVFLRPRTQATLT